LRPARLDFLRRQMGQWFFRLARAALRFLCAGDTFLRLAPSQPLSPAFW